MCTNLLGMGQGKMLTYSNSPNRLYFIRTFFRVFVFSIKLNDPIQSLKTTVGYVADLHRFLSLTFTKRGRSEMCVDTKTQTVHMRIQN